MPLLPKEIELLPDDLFELDGAEFPWNVAHVRSRQEKALARWLAERVIPFYLPQITRRSRSNPEARERISYIPLFPGYVFFRGAGTARNAALRSDLIANVIDVTDQELLGEQLLQIRRLQEAGASFEPFHDLVPGDPVRITTGPFAGYTGIVMRHGRAQRLIVELSLLRKRAAVEFDTAVLKRAAR